MSIGNIAYSVFRNALTCTMAGYNGAILGSKIARKTNIFADDKNREILINIISFAIIAFACLSGRDIAHFIIPNRLKWSILKPMGEIFSEIVLGRATLYLAHTTLFLAYKGSANNKGPNPRPPTPLTKKSSNTDPKNPHFPES